MYSLKISSQQDPHESKAWALAYQQTCQRYEQLLDYVVKALAGLPLHKNSVLARLQSLVGCLWNLNVVAISHLIACASCTQLPRLVFNGNELADVLLLEGCPCHIKGHLTNMSPHFRPESLACSSSLTYLAALKLIAKFAHICAHTYTYTRTACIDVERKD